MTICIALQLQVEKQCIEKTKGKGEKINKNKGQVGIKSRWEHDQKIWYWQISWKETKKSSVELISCNLSAKHILSLMEIYFKWVQKKIIITLTS